MRQLFIYLIVLFISLIANAQEPQFKIVDAYSKQPIPNAHICTESKDKKTEHFWITDRNGIKENLLTQKSKIAVSFIGYITFIDSVLPGKSYTIKLTPKTESLNEVVVTGQFKPETVDKSIYNVQVINKLDIQNKAATNLSELLNNELNIQIENNGILGSNITMQGLSGEHIKILIDGVPVIGRQNGNIDLNQLNLQNIDHIEIIEGPMSVIYGSNALAGAINLISKKNTRPNFSIGSNVYYESVGIYNADIFAVKNLNNHYFSLTTGRNLFDGYKLNPDFRTYTFNPKNQYFSTLNYKTNIRALNIDFAQDLFNERLINYGAVIPSGLLTIDSNQYQLPFADDENHYTFRTNSKLNLTYEINESSKIDMVSAYSYYQKIKNTQRKQLYDLITAPSDDSSKHDTTFFNAIMSRASYLKSFNNLELLSGYDINYETGDGKRIIDVKHIGEYAGFINFKYQPYTKLSIQSGARYIYNTKYNSAYVYSINGKYDPTDKINIRMSYGKGFRSPSLKELYLNFVDDSHNIQGNPELTPEYSENYNLSTNISFGHKSHHLDGALKFYHNKIKDKIDLIPESDSSVRANYLNIKGVYKTIGMQWDNTYRFHPRLKVNFGLGLSGKSKIADLNAYTYTTNYAASFNYSNIKYLFKINIYFKRYGKDSQYYLQTIDGVESIRESSRDAYSLMDLTVSKPFFNENLNVSCGIKNLFNYKSVRGSSGSGDVHGGGDDAGSAVSWGRSFFIKLNFNLTKF